MMVVKPTMAGNNNRLMKVLWVNILKFVTRSERGRLERCDQAGVGQAHTL
jgi:hypothetical protein